MTNPIVEAIYRAWRGEVPQRPAKRGRKRARASMFQSLEPALARLWHHLRRRGG